MIYDLRPYQSDGAYAAIEEAKKGVTGTLILAPTGTGKTIVIAKLAEESVIKGYKILILANRNLLCLQAQDKILKSTGIYSALEMGSRYSKDEHNKFKTIVIASVQSISNQERLDQFEKDEFDIIITDEAHVTASPTYRRVFEYFNSAFRIGLTATNYRLDGKSLVSKDLYETISSNYTLPEAINDGWLVPLKAMVLPIKIDYSNIATGGNQEISAKENATALDPYLEQIVLELSKICRTKKTVLFLPLVATSQKTAAMFERQGFKTIEINGETKNKDDVLEQIDKAPIGTVILNAMLLTTGWDCESVDCVVVLRNTKSWSLYMQMLGRGTRPLVNQKEFNAAKSSAERKKIIEASPKKNLLIIDFLYNIKTMNLCRPPSAFITDEEPDTVRFEKSVEMLENEDFGSEVDLMELSDESYSEATKQREENLAKKIKENEKKKKSMLNASDLFSEEFKEELMNFKPSDLTPIENEQKIALEKNGINSDSLKTKEEAEKLIEVVTKRKEQEMSTPKQIRLLEQRGFNNVKYWSSKEAKKVIFGIKNTGWRSTPTWVGDPSTYAPSK